MSSANGAPGGWGDRRLCDSRLSGARLEVLRSIEIHEGASLLDVGPSRPSAGPVAAGPHTVPASDGPLHGLRG
jgi:hypothetical protein